MSERQVIIKESIKSQVFFMLGGSGGGLVALLLGYGEKWIQLASIPVFIISVFLGYKGMMIPINRNDLFKKNKKSNRRIDIRKIQGLAYSLFAFFFAYGAVSAYIHKAESEAFQETSYEIESVTSAAISYRFDTGKWPSTPEDLTTGENKRLFLPIVNKVYKFSASGDKFIVRFNADSAHAAKAIQKMLQNRTGRTSSVASDEVSVSTVIDIESFIPPFFLVNPDIPGCPECEALEKDTHTDIEVDEGNPQSWTIKKALENLDEAVVFWNQALVKGNSIIHLREAADEFCKYKKEQRSKCVDRDVTELAQYVNAKQG